MIGLGDALLKLNADDTELRKKLGNVEKQMDKVAKVAMGIGLAITAALVGATVAAAKFGDEIAKMSKRTGIGTVALSEMRYMADQSGTSIEALETGIKRMQRTIIDASDGLSTAMRAFDRLGISIDNIIDLSPEEQFWALAEAISDIHDPTLKAAVAQEIFGRAGTQMLPMLSDGAAGIEKLREDFVKYGRVVTEEGAAKSEAFMNALDNLKQSFGKLADEVGIELMPILENLLTNKIIPLVSKIVDWVKDNEGLVVSLGRVTLAFVGAAGIYMAIKKVITVVKSLQVAWAVMLSLMGPKGWAILAAGLGIAAFAIKSIRDMQGEAPDPDVYRRPLGEGEELGEHGPGIVVPPREHGPALPPGWGDDFQWGGRVPGPLGHRVPITAHGGEEYLGVGNMARSPAMGTTIVNLGLLPGDDITLRKLQRLFKDVSGEDARRQSFGQVNQGYFYGRSSA